MARKSNNPFRLPGCFMTIKCRWYWTVRLPGDDKPRQRALVPDGAEMATTDKQVAYQVALQMLERAKVKAANGGGDTAWDGTLGALVRKYRAYAPTYYKNEDGSPTSQVSNIDDATEPLLSDKYANLPVEKFDSAMLVDVRDNWIKNGGKRGIPLCRTTINARVKIIQAMFEWATPKKLVSGYQCYDLNTVRAIREGRTPDGAHESKEVQPVAPEIVRATQAMMTRVLKDMTELHMLCGMRSTEVCFMAPKYIDRSNPEVWVYNVPDEANKMSYRKQERRVPIVGKAQDILSSYLLRPPDAYCFSPKESEDQRLAALRSARKSGLDKQGRPSSNKARDSKRTIRAFGDRFDKDSYRRAIEHALQRVNKQRLEQELEPLPHWHPHMLRHTAATIARNADGGTLDHVLGLLGQRTTRVGERYAKLLPLQAIQAAKSVVASVG